MEIVVKTLTRHRDPKSRLYLRDWTAGDILMIGEDGEIFPFLSDQMRKMNLLLYVPGRAPKDIQWNVFADDRMHGDTYRDLLYRCSHIIDLQSILTRTELIDCFNHDKPVATKELPLESYLSLVKSRETRTELITEFDVHGSVTTGVYTVGSGGDYATYSAAESDIADLTGGLTFNGFDTSTDTTAVVVTGFTTGAYELTFGTSGSGVHGGVAGAGYKHRPTSGHAWNINLQAGSIVNLDGMDVRNGSTGSSDECFRLAEVGTINAIDSFIGFASRNDQQDGFYVDSGQAPTFNMTNCIGYGVYRGFFDIYVADNGVEININSCTFFNCGNSTSSASRSGIVGHAHDTGKYITANIFNSLCNLNAGYAVTSTTASDTINIDRCVTNASAWTNQSLDVDTDNQESVTFQDTTPSANCVYWKDDDTNPYDLRLEDDETYNIAQDAHSDGSGVSQTMPSEDISGNTRSAPYCVGASRVEAETGDVTIEGVSSAIKVTPNVGTVVTDVIIAGSTSAITATPNAGTVVTDVIIAGSTSAITATPNAGTVVTDVIIAGSTSAITATPNVGTVVTDVIISGAVSSITVTPNAGTVSTETGAVTVEGVVSSITVTPNVGTVVTDATVEGGASSIVVTTNAGTVVTDVIIAGSTSAITVTPNAGLVTTDVVIAGSVSSITVTPNAGTVVTDVIIAGSVSSITVTPNAGTVSTTAGATTVEGVSSSITVTANAGTVLTTINTGTMEVSFTQVRPSMTFTAVKPSLTFTHVRPTITFTQE